MAINVLFTNGIIAAKERFLLKDKLVKLCEMTADDAFRTLLESGFGSGAEAADVHEYEKLIAADEAAIDDFIREYAPSPAEAEYLLSPRDFHNAKALVKATYLNTDAGKLLAPEGLVAVSAIMLAIQGGDRSALPKEMAEALAETESLFSGEENAVSGAKIGAVFDKALFRHLKAVCKSRLLKKLLSARADMTNIITAFRSSSPEYARELYVTGGVVSAEKLQLLFGAEDAALRAFEKTEYARFVALCFDAKRAGKPLTEAERLRDSAETAYFTARKYETEGNYPFLYYVFRRRAENENVRLVLVCLLAGMKEHEVKARLRVF